MSEVRDRIRGAIGGHFPPPPVHRGRAGEGVRFLQAMRIFKHTEIGSEIGNSAPTLALPRNTGGGDKEQPPVPSASPSDGPIKKNAIAVA